MKMDRKTMQAIRSTIKSSLLREMLSAIEKGARAAAKAELLTEVIGHQEKANHGIVQPLPEDFFTGIQADKMKAEEESKASQQEAMKALAAFEVERAAKAAGAKNPSVVALALSGEAEADFDKYGDVAFTIIDKATGKARYNPRTGTPYNLADYISEMKASPENGYLFQGGREADASTSQKNPWRRDAFNLTKQAQILRENPALAAKLKAEAGKR